MNPALPALAVAAAACSDPAPYLLPQDVIDRCLVPGDYGALGSKSGTTTTVGTGNPALTVVLDPGPPKDDFFLRLVAGSGAFTGGPVAPGSYPLTGADADATRCGVCTNVIADIVSGLGPTKFYFAVAGSVTIHSISPITGSAQDLRLIEVTDSGTTVPGGCTTAIGSIAFGP